MFTLLSDVHFTNAQRRARIDRDHAGTRRPHPRSWIKVRLRAPRASTNETSTIVLGLFVINKGVSPPQMTSSRYIFKLVTHTCTKVQAITTI